MKVTCFAVLAMCAVLGLAIADDFFGGDDYGYGSSGYGYGSSGYGSGYGGYGSGGAKYIPVPLAGGQSSGSGIGSLLPILLLVGLLPILLNLFNTGSTQDQIVLVNSTLTG